MNKQAVMKYLPWSILSAGAVGMLLRIWMYAGAEESGMLKPNHVPVWLLLLLTSAVVSVLIWMTWDLRQATKYSFNFPASLPGAVGRGVGAAGIAVTALTELLRGGDLLTGLTGVLGLTAAAGLVFLCQCRRKGRHPSLVFHGLVCLYLMLHLVCRYRQWCSWPQVADYCPNLLAEVCVMLAVYTDAAFDANCADRRQHTFFHLLAVFFCMVAIPYGGTPILSACMGVWMFTDLCSLIPMPGRKR